ncbi:MAG: hypothetical protein KDD82_11765 [Planctomycetes bacterium]|nr:hypothetical protein [Planctomycetota bacterium]
MSAWEVYPHGALRQLADRLWAVEGSLPRLPVPRTMFVYRLEEGGLLVWSSVALDEAGMRELDALGPVQWIVVPNRFHRMQARAYLERYPAARVLCPAAARDHVAKEVTVHGTVEAELPPLGISVHADAGIKPSEVVYEFPLADGAALLFCDALFNLPNRGGLKGWIVRLIGSSGFFGVTRIGRWFVVDDAQRFREFLLEQSARDDLVLLGVAHGECVTQSCGRRLVEAAARL